MARDRELSVTKSNLIVQGMIFACGTTAFKAGTTMSGGTNLDTYAGYIYAAGGFLSAAATFKGPLYFAAGDKKTFACGTYIGLGGATAPITTTGLTTVRKVWMSPKVELYASATTLARNYPRPAMAAGTVGKFYPMVYRTAATNKNVQLGTGVSATWNWFALGTL
jgi:hypothetical protein